MTQVWQSVDWPKFGYDRAFIEPLMAAAADHLGQAIGLQNGLRIADHTDLVQSQITQEAVASFGIEGVTLQPAEIQASIVASLKHKGAVVIDRRADAIAALLVAARNTHAPMTQEVLCDWHKLLFFGIEVEDKGRWRQFDLDIMRSAVPGNAEILYKAPPPKILPDEMVRFLTWLNTTSEMAVPLKAAIAHLWFESIHPFSDGNGRIGRAIVDFVFAQSTPLPFSLSVQIEKDKQGYYDALQAGRKQGLGHIDATAFVAWFLKVLAKAAGHSQEQMMFLVRRNRFFEKFETQLSDRQDQVIRKLFAQGPARVALGISAKSYCKMAHVSPATATRDLAVLETIGALKRSTAGGRSTTYHPAA